MDTNLTKKDTESKVEKVAARPTVTPRVDIYENNDELLLLADLPGVNEDRLRIHIDKDQLTLEGVAAVEPTATVVAREWRAFDYSRTFVLPGGIDTAKIAAELKDGVLRLHLPKADAVRPRRIEVKGG